MNAPLRLKTLRAILCATGVTPWRWVLLDSEGTAEAPVRMLVQDDAREQPNILAIGAVLSPQARAIALLHPAVLDEMSDIESLCVESLERLELVVRQLATVRRRAYAGHQREQYADLTFSLSEIAKAIALLKRTHWFLTQREFDAWEESAVSELTGDGT